MRFYAILKIDIFLFSHLEFLHLNYEMRHAIFKLLIIVSLIVASLILLIRFFLHSKSSDGLNSNSISHQLEQKLEYLDEISKQLADVKNLNRNYKFELSSIKQQLEMFIVVHGSDTSHEQGSSSKSAIVSFLPNLIDHPEALQPTIHLKPNKKKSHYSFVFGITATKRDKGNLTLDTLRSLVQGLSEIDESDVFFVIFIEDETDVNFVSSIVKAIEEYLPKALEKNFVEIVSPKAVYFPKMDKIKSTFGDSVEQTGKRTKEVLSLTFLMMYCQNLGTYFMHLPDNITTKDGFVSDIRHFILQQHSNEWLMLDFASELSGISGKLLRSSEVGLFSEFFLMFHSEKSASWLFEDFLQTKYCNPEKSPEDCIHEKDAARRRRRPSLFNQIGVTPSPTVGKYPGNIRMFIPHENPVASISTTLTHYEDHTIEAAYNGDTFFWALNPKINDTIILELTPPVRLKAFKFRSGNAEHIDDRFYETVVEIKFNSEEPISQSMFRSMEQEYLVKPGSDFVQAGVFNR